MLADVLTIAWKESKEFVQGSSRAGTIGRIVFPMALTGILIPLRAGHAYLTGPTAFMSIAWILPMVAVSLTVDAVAGERERHTLESLLATRLSDQAVLFGKLTASVAYAWGMVLISLLLGLVTVNLGYGQGTWLLFRSSEVAALLMVSFLGSVLVSSAAVLVSVRAPTVRQAAQTFGFGSTAFIAGIILVRQLMPSTWRIWLQTMLSGPSGGIVAVLLFTALDVAVLAAAYHRFQRSRLILD